MSGYAGKNDKAVIMCSIWDKQSNTTCSSIQNAAFHGCASHRQTSQKGFHTKAFQKDGHFQQGAGMATTRKEWEKAAKESRKAEMEEASKLLLEPEVDGDRVLLLIQEVTLVTGLERKLTKSSVFHDRGSTCSMVTKELVKRLSIESISKSVIVQSFGHQDAIDTEFVVLELLKYDGTVTRIRAYVVDSITEMPKVAVPEELKEAFSMKQDWPKERYHGSIEILLGIEELASQPKRLQLVGNLGIFRSPLSSTTILGGRHERIKPEKTELSQACMMMRRAAAPVAQKAFRIRQEDRTFQMGDAMGDYVPKTCNNCRKCQSCTFAGSSISQRDRLELEYINRGITYDEENCQFKVRYPFIEDPAEALTDNRNQAIAYGLSLEKKLEKNGMKENFNTEFEKFLTTKSLREITKKEMSEWKGAVHYVPLQLVINENSSSTPFRIVTNTSCRDPKTGKSLNMITAKGPNMLSDPFKILLRFRNRKYAISTDVTKAYHGLRTGPVEMHLRRVVYRQDVKSEWKTYGFLCVSFGDVAAQAILECCLLRVAKMNRSMDWVAALMVELDRFVDDLPSGSDMKEVIQRLRGEILANWQTTGTLAALFAKGGFILKVIACSGDPDGPMVRKLGGAVLGINWKTDTDKFSINLTVNVTRRRRGEPTGDDVTIANLEEITKAVLSRRIVLSITMSLYDPLGYICPLTIRLKWLIQQLGKPEEKKGWDEPLEVAESEPWVKILKLMVEQGSIAFSRSCKPENTDLEKEVILVNYMDGSNAGKAFVSYIRYMLHSGQAHVSLLSAKSKLNAVGGQSTVRSEMDGHTMAARGARTTMDALKEVTPAITKIYMLGDSRTVLQALKAGAAPFSEWMANRISEVYDCFRDIPENVEVIWAWVASKDNTADIASRTDAVPMDLIEGSVWQDGPAYLKLPEEMWPINTKIMEETRDLPKEEMRRQAKHLAFHQTVEKTVSPLTEIARQTSCWEVALKKTRNLSYWLEQHRARNIMSLEEQGIITRLRAEHELALLAAKHGLNYWLVHAGKDTIALLEKGGLKNMVVEIRENIPMVQTRFKKKVQHYFGVTELPLILASTDLGRMLCLDAHNKTHRSGDLALAVTKQVAYIVGGRNMLLSIRRKCI